MTAKYIVYANEGSLHVEIFNSIINHFDRARVLGILGDVESAGEFRIDAAPIDGMNVPVACTFGRSVTLGKTSRPGDARLINQLLRIGQYYGV